MEKTPISMRTHVSIFGNTNAGKSALFNRLLNQDMSIVSEKSGTTTDPVTKAMELIPFGPVALTDTAGLGDKTQIGEKREEKTRKILDRTDFAVYAADVSDFDEAAYEEFKSETEKRNIEHMLVFTKSDLAKGKYLDRYPNAAEVSVYDEESIEKLRNLLSERLSKSDESKDTMIGGLLPSGSTVVLVIPIDSEAPKGRIILPQVQLLRDCLDHGMKAVCVRDSELKETLDELKKVDLVVTDSQAFKTVSEIVPQNIMFTSFSMMTASLKGDLGVFVRGAEKIESLRDGSRILMAEACTHNVSHEDIGRKKIPLLLRKYTGKDLEFDYCVYQDFPDNLDGYDLVIHCGGCMINARTMKNRMLYCEKAGVAITNYGVSLAYVNGILDRSIKIFKL